MPEWLEPVVYAGGALVGLLVARRGGVAARDWYIRRHRARLEEARRRAVETVRREERGGRGE